jgi:hypothetical protein
MFGSLLKAAAVVIDVPASAARDVVTAGDMSSKAPKTGSHTGDALERFFDNVKDVADPDK